MESVFAFPYACAIITGCGQWVHGPWGERILHSWIVKSGGTVYHVCPWKTIRWDMQSGPFIGIFYRYLHIVREPYFCVSIHEGNVPRDINVTKAFIQGFR